MNRDEKASDRGFVFSGACLRESKEGGRRRSGGGERWKYMTGWSLNARDWRKDFRGN